MAMKLSQSTFNFYYVYVRLWYAVSFYMLHEYFSIALGSLDDRGNFLICGIYADKEVVGKDAVGRCCEDYPHTLVLPGQWLTGHWHSIVGFSDLWPLMACVLFHTVLRCKLRAYRAGGPQAWHAEPGCLWLACVRDCSSGHLRRGLAAGNTFALFAPHALSLDLFPSGCCL